MSYEKANWLTVKTDHKHWSVAKINLENITNTGVGKGFKNMTNIHIYERYSYKTVKICIYIHQR